MRYYTKIKERNKMPGNQTKITIIKSEELSEIYDKINEQMSDYIDTNENSMIANELPTEEQDLQKVFEKIATEMIKNKLLSINNEFENYTEQQQKYCIKLNTKEIEKIMKQKLNETFEK